MLQGYVKNGIFSENSSTLYKAILKPVVMCDVSSKKGLPSNIFKKMFICKIFQNHLGAFLSNCNLFSNILHNLQVFMHPDDIS